MARCEQATFGDQLVCKHSVHKYQSVKAAILAAGLAFVLRLIQGAYNTSVGASKGTHAGGGVTDHEYDGYTWSVASAVSRIFRRNMLLEWIRWWSGNHHGHALDPECPNLSPEAIAQFLEFGKNGDGLVGDSADPGDRTYATQIMSLFNNRRSNPSRIKLIQRGLGLTPDGVWGKITDTAVERVRSTKVGVRAVQTGLLVDADGTWGPMTEQAYNSLRPAAYKLSSTTQTTNQEDDVQLTDQVKLTQAADVQYSSPSVSVEGILASTNYYVLQTRNQLSKLLQDQSTQLAALTAAVTALSQANGVDPAEIQATVNSAVRDALDNLRIVDVPTAV